MATIRFYWKVLKNTFTNFNENYIFAYSGALSYYAIFSLPPTLLIILHVTKLFCSEAQVEGALFSQIEELAGKDGAQQIMEAIENIQILEPTILSTILSICLLIFTSTTVLVTMQIVLNRIFRIKPKPQGWGILKTIRDRVLSFVILIGFAFILLVSLVVDALISAFSVYLEEWIGEVYVTLALIASMVLSFLILTLLLASIFKFLPDANLKWKDTWFGAMLTSILFGLGKYLISFYIGTSNIANLYDTAGSVMVIMVWVFYASLIIMFGAVFTYTRVNMLGEIIPPSDYAVKIE